MYSSFFIMLDFPGTVKFLVGTLQSDLSGNDYQGTRRPLIIPALKGSHSSHKKACGFSDMSL